LIAVALFFVVPILFKAARGNVDMEVDTNIYRDQLRELDADLAAGTLNKEQHRRARRELENRVRENSASADEKNASSAGRWLVVAGVGMIALLALALYFMLGKQAENSHDKQAAEQSPNVTQAQINAMVEGLAQRLKDKPDDVEGWAMLGRSYTTLRRFSDASAAYARAVALMPGNAELLTEYADVLAMTNGRNMQGEPEKIILRALQSDPVNIKALALAGTAAFQRQDYRSAIELWQKLLKLVPPEDQWARTASANISQAQGLSGLPLSGQPFAVRANEGAARGKSMPRAEP
jgi:cytochrome c-type biogenesis protein CcmH